MRCPKCEYISFDNITSCSQCETDVTELASALHGTGFQPLNNFYLGKLLPDYMTALDVAPSSLQSAADDLNISVDDLDTLGDIGDLPGETTDVDPGPYDEDETISLHGVDVPEMDLSDFDDEHGNTDTMEISAEQLDHLDLVDVDVTDFNLDDVDFAEEGQVEEKTEILNADGLDIGEDKDTPKVDLADIDLSLGEDEGGKGDEATDLADLDLGELEMESDSDNDDDLPDLKL
ncbi:MAG: hypothetical protein PF442_12625 [Desulfobulbaceae bacterium]|jgi:hypothetical protein|nr:hypothetical protein [Desulfobulbaceae bacterium]